jgi:ribose transport system permease protein
MSTAEASAPPGVAARLFSSGAHQKLLAFASLIALLVGFTLASPNFMQMTNIIAILQATSVNGVLAIGSSTTVTYQPIPRRSSPVR